MANLSFTSQGAVPKVGLSLSPSSGGLSFGGALSNALNRAQGAPAPTTGPLRSVYTPPPAIPAPSTPVKSTTVNNTDGSSHVTTYHAPTTGLLSGESTGSSTSQPTTPTTQYSANGKSVGTQLPGMAGFSPINSSAPTRTQNVEQYYANGNATGTTNTPNSFPGMIGGLTGAASNGSPAAQGYTAATANYGAGNIPIGQKAQQIADQYGKQIADVGGKGAQFESGQLTTGTSPVASGNAAVTAQTTAAQQLALATGEQAALQGIGYQLTGQNQAASAANSAAGQANTGQELVQAGLTSAAKLAQPSATAQGQTTFDPLMGKFTGGSYGTNLQTVVDAIKNGSIGYTDGVNSLSGLSPTAKADVLAQLGSGFDTIASDANASAKGSNITTGGTATTSANASGLQQAIKDETDLTAQANAASSLAEQVNTAVHAAGLDLTQSNDANATLNNLKSRLGSPEYAALNIAVNDARSAYAGILQSQGMTPTDAGAAASQNLGTNMPIKQMLASIDQLNQGVGAKLSAAHTRTARYQSQLSGSGSSGGSSSSGSSSGSSFGWVG